VLGSGRFGAVTADGLGIRGVDWRGGQSIDSITVLGDGHRLTTTSFEPTVLMSGSVPIDPFFGTKPNPLTDLFVVTHTTPKSPQRKGTSASGSMDQSVIQVSRDVGFVKANTIRLDVFNVGNNVGSISTTDYADSLVLTAGRIDSLNIGKDALREDVSIAGPIGAINVGGSFRGSSKIAASGPNGSIGNVTVNKTLYGNISSSHEINSIKVGTHYGSQGTHAGGNIKQFVTGGNFNTGAVLDLNKTLSKLVIGGDFEDGAIIRASDFGTVTIVGDNLGDLIDKTP